MRIWTPILMILCLAPPVLAQDDAPKSADVFLGKRQDPVKMESPPAPRIPAATPESADALKYKALTPNLLKNGSFEEGKYWPYFWEPVDNLCIFWDESGGSDGKRCLRMYTDVLEDQAVPWNSKVRAIIDDLSEKTGGKPQSVDRNPIPTPPERAPTHPPYYDTVAGLHGCLLLSDPYKLVPGGIYRVSLDVRNDKNQGNPILFVKGYFKYGGRWRNCGRLQMKLTGCRNTWQTWSVVFHPSAWTNQFGDFPARPEVLKIQLYSYWQPGNYYFDNVRMEIVGFEPYKQLRNPTAVDVKKMYEPKKSDEPDKADGEMKEGEFPTF